MNTKTILIALLVLLFIGLGTVLLYANREKLFGKGKDEGAGNGNEGNDEQAPAGFPLKRGSNNQYVKRLQEYLLTRNANCLPTYGADGDWGTETETCITSVLGINVVDYNKYKSLGLA